MTALDPCIIRSANVYETAPFPSCHASTLVQTEAGTILVAFFGGTGEGKPDVCVWLAEFDGNTWTAPRKVSDGVMPDGSSFPCWNPVLFRPKNGPVLLFHKVGKNPSTWWGMLLQSDDHGKTWSAKRRIDDPLL